MKKKLWIALAVIFLLIVYTISRKVYVVESNMDLNMKYKWKNRPSYWRRITKTDSLKYDTLRFKDFNSMSSKDTYIFEEVLIEKLKKDKDYNKLCYLQYLKTNEMIKSSPYYKPKVKIGKFPSTLGGWINYYKTKGIQNPSDYAENMLLTLYYTRVVFLKYPELKRLPKDKTLSIFKAAKPLMSDQMARERRMLLDTLILESNR